MSDGDVAGEERRTAEDRAVSEGRARTRIGP